MIPLQQITVASPCHASWDEMSGDEKQRHCASCQKSVYNLSEMTEAEGQALLDRTHGRVCVRFYRRADGTVMTQDCPVGLRAVRRRIAAAVGWATASILGVLFAPVRPVNGTPTMGAPPPYPNVQTMGKPVAPAPVRPVVQGNPMIRQAIMGDVAMPPRTGTGSGHTVGPKSHVKPRPHVLQGRIAMPDKKRHSR